MRLTRLLLIATLGLVTLLASRSAFAQTTTGAIQGRALDKASGAGLADVSVVVTGPALQGSMAELTDESGLFTITNLPPGTYEVVFYYNKTTVRQPGVTVNAGKQTPVYVKINTSDEAAKVEVIRQKAPPIDTGSAKGGLTIGKDYVRNIPLAGRGYESAIGAAAGTQGDALGVSVGGSTSIENNYVIDGVNTGGLTYGTANTPLLTDFIEETEVITGGYNAEFGRSTGGVINVVTKSGSNEFRGSVFFNISPGQIQGSADPVSTAGAALSAAGDRDYLVDFGFEMGGPIIKDKLWFYVGFAPSLSKVTYTRIVSTQIDRRVNNFKYELDPSDAEDLDGDDILDGVNFYTDANGDIQYYTDANGNYVRDADGNPNTSNGLVDVGGRMVQCELVGRCEEDGAPDKGSDGFNLFEEIPQARREISNDAISYQFTAKVNFAVSPDHQGTISIIGIPGRGDGPGLAGSRRATDVETESLSLDGSIKWNSKFNNNKTEVDVVLGYHQFKVYDTPLDPALRNVPRTILLDTDLGSVGRNPDERESDDVLRFCTDNDPLIRDQFGKITNCPIDGYIWDSPGFLTNINEKRYSAKVTVTQRLRAAGHHTFKGGLDVEDNNLADYGVRTGGVSYTLFKSGSTKIWEADRDVNRVDARNPDGSPIGGDTCVVFDENSNPIKRPCNFLGAGEYNRDSETLNWSAFVQDSWQIRPNLTLNIGLRYEEQRLRTGDFIRDTQDPLTGRRLGKNALVLDGLLAPRVGLLYDWTKEGRSKAYVNWGRFYESIPMDINNRAFGGEIQYQSYFLADSQCGAAPMGDPNTTPRVPSLPANCPSDFSQDANFPVGTDLLGGGDPGLGLAPGLALIQPNLGAQYLDEFTLGVEYELLEDLRVGVQYQNRRLGQVIEDVSPDGGNTYVIANPGTSADTSDLEAFLDNPAIPMNDPKRDQVKRRIEVFKGIKDFDKPRRDYNAFQLTAFKRFSGGLFVQGSYTYSVLEGNYPGLYSPDNGQVDPNITSQYDLYELLANREGRLPYDRPHNIKLDGYYTFDLKKAGEVTAGLRFRALSGIPSNYLGRHEVYGPNESFVLPRGSGDRTPFVTQTDIRLQYTRPIGKDLRVSFYFDLVNLFDQQIDSAVDDEYTQDRVNPIVGGTVKDLRHLKVLESGVPTRTPARRKLNFGNVTGRLAPISTRFGIRLEF